MPSPRFRCYYRYCRLLLQSFALRFDAASLPPLFQMLFAPCCRFRFSAALRRAISQAQRARGEPEGALFAIFLYFEMIFDAADSRCHCFRYARMLFAAAAAPAASAIVSYFACIAALLIITPATLAAFLPMMPPSLFRCHAMMPLRQLIIADAAMLLLICSLHHHHSPPPAHLHPPTFHRPRTNSTESPARARFAVRRCRRLLLSMPTLLTPMLPLDAAMP